jgi:hypothetical protein
MQIKNIRLIINLRNMLKQKNVNHTMKFEQNTQYERMNFLPQIY